MGNSASSTQEDERKLLTDVHHRSGFGTSPGDVPDERELVAAINVLGLKLLGILGESTPEPGGGQGPTGTFFVSPPLISILICAAAAAASLDSLDKKLIPELSTVAEELIDLVTLPIVDPAVFQAVAAVCQLSLLAPASAVELVAGLSMWFSGQLALDISPAFAETLSRTLGVEVRELTGPTAAPLDGWAALRSGDRIACVFDKFDAARNPQAPPSVGRNGLFSLRAAPHAGAKMVAHGCFLLASVVSLSVSLPVTASERSFFTNAKRAQMPCMMLTLAARPTRYVEVWAKEASEEGLSLGHLVADPDLLFVIPQGLAAQIVEYPLDDSFEAVIIAPSAALGLNRLVKALSSLPARWALWTGALRQRDVSVRLPAFRIEATNRFKEALRGLGLKETFAEEADGSFARAVGGPLAFEDLYVSGILEVAAAVDPEADGSSAPQGAVAAAAPRGAAGPASSALVAVGSRQGQNREVPRVPFGVVFNKPFLFFVRECATGAIVMAAQVSQPQLLGLAQPSDRLPALQGGGGGAPPGVRLAIGAGSAAAAASPSRPAAASGGAGGAASPARGAEAAAAAAGEGGEGLVADDEEDA